MNTVGIDPNQPFSGVVKPDSWLGCLLSRLANSRRFRWRQYYAACAKIPRHSPVHGLTSWKRINKRRCDLIGKKLDKGLTVKQAEEYAALKHVCRCCTYGGHIVGCFVMGRVTRRLMARLDALTARHPTPARRKR